MILGFGVFGVWGYRGLGCGGLGFWDLGFGTGI